MFRFKYKFIHLIQIKKFRKIKSKEKKLILEISPYFSASNIQINLDMKKTITTVASMALVLGLTAQNSSSDAQLPQLQSANAPNSTIFIPENAESNSFTRGGGNSGTTAAFGDTLFHESFSDGFNGDPGNGAWTCPTRLGPGHARAGSFWS